MARAVATVQWRKLRDGSLPGGPSRLSFSGSSPVSCADAAMPIGDPAPLGFGQIHGGAGRIDDDEIIARAMHLGELELSRHVGLSASCCPGIQLLRGRLHLRA